MCLFWTPAGVCRGDPQDNSWATATCVDFGRLRVGPTADEIRSLILNRCNAMQCNAMQCNAMHCAAASCGALRQASAALSHPPRNPMAILRIPVVGVGGRVRLPPTETQWASSGPLRQASAAVSHPLRDPMAILRIPGVGVGRRRQLCHIHPETRWPSCGSPWIAAHGHPVGFLRTPSENSGSGFTSTGPPTETQ